jgi:transposase
VAEVDGAGGVLVLARGRSNGFDHRVSDLEGLSREELVAAGRVKDARIAELAEQNEALVTAHEQLMAAYDELVVKVAKLEHLLSRNSGNSSSPPSKDEDPGRTPAKGKAGSTSKRVRGKQPGAPGSYLSWSDAPDDQQDRFPHGACACGADLDGAADLGVVDSYQQTEIPTMRAAVTQYDQHAVRCGCGKVHAATRPDGARGAGKVGYGPVLQAWAVYLMVVHHLPTHRCRQLLEALTGAKPSVGFVHGLLARVGAALRVADHRIRTLITLVRVLCMDETPIRVGPKTPRPGRKKADKYLLIACTHLYTHFLLGDRDLDTFKASVLKDVAAGTVVVHDRYTVYDHDEFTGIVHQLCTQHLLRDLTGAGEVYPDAVWPAQITQALRGLIHATNTAREQGQTQIDPTVRDKLLYTLRHGVLVGLADTTTGGTRPGERKARLLLEVFRDRPDDILRFVDDLSVPPTSNDAERGLRPSKIQQNISGRLTSLARTQDRYRILGYLATAAQHGHDKMTAVLDVVHGRIWMPDLPAVT